MDIIMKYIILYTTLLITSFVQAQDFSNITNSDEGIKEATILASKTSNSQLLNSQNFEEEHIFAVRFIPAEMSVEQYDQMDSTHQNKLLTVVYKTIGNAYVFDEVTASYDVLFALWQTDISKQETAKDNQNKKYFDKENRIVYLLTEDNDDRWRISRKLL